MTEVETCDHCNEPFTEDKPLKQIAVYTANAENGPEFDSFNEYGVHEGCGDAFLAFLNGMCEHCGKQVHDLDFQIRRFGGIDHQVHEECKDAFLLTAMELRALRFG